MTNNFLPIGLDSFVEGFQLINNVARPQLQKNVHHPKALFLSAAILEVLQGGLVALLAVVLEFIKCDVLQTNLFIFHNKHGQIKDVHGVPLNVDVVAVHARYKLLTLLKKFDLVVDQIFLLLVVKAVFMRSCMLAR